MPAFLRLALDENPRALSGVFSIARGILVAFSNHPRRTDAMTYNVTIQANGQTFTVEEDEPVLDAAIRHGVPLPYGCRNGTCGTCAGKVVEGEYRYPRQPKAVKQGNVAEGDVLFCSARPLSDLVIDVQLVEEEAAIPVKIVPARVEALERMSHDVMLVKLKLPESQRMQYLAGQYIEFLLRDGRRRAFSIANAPHDDEFLTLHIREVPGGYFTHYVFHDLKERAMLRIEGPHGGFYLREESDRPIIMMAGGTGFGPCKAMIEHAIETGLQRPIELYWGVRSREDLYMGELAEQWTKDHDWIRYIPVLSEPKAEDNWSGETGWVHEVVAREHPNLSGYDVYLCGPPPMIEAGKKAFLARGLPADRLYFDSFDFSEGK